MKTGSHEAAGGCMMFRAVWPTESGSRSLIGVVLGQRGDNLITAGLDAAKQLVDRLAPNAAPPPAGAYRRHIENHIRAGNTPLP
jgi:D-alanyl-D-alanine carboxypeptidase (penicillin-binding protein 5/6)